MFNPLPPPDEEKYTPKFQKPDLSADSPPSEAASDGPVRPRRTRDDYEDDLDEVQRYPRRGYYNEESAAQRRLLNWVSIYLSILGLLGMLGSGLLCLVGLMAAGDRNAGGAFLASAFQGFFRRPVADNLPAVRVLGFDGDVVFGQGR